MYEKKLAELQTQLHESSTASSSVSPSGPRQHKHITLEEEWEDQNRERLMNTVLLANQLVREANMLSEALNKDTLFRVTLTVSCRYGDRCHGDVYLCRVPASFFLFTLSLSISLFPSSMYTFSSLLPPPFLPSSSLPQIPKSFLSPRQYLSSEEMHTSNEIAIRVIHRQRGTDSVWSLNTLAEKVLTMRDMYQRIEEGSFGLVLVGVASS